MIRAVVLFLLLLLKILGWTLLALLLLLAAVLLLVLFVPLRYDVQIQNERSMEPGQKNPAANLQLQLKVTWLLHLLRFSVSYGPQGIQNKIQAAGIDIPKVLAQLAKRKERKRRRGKAGKKNSQAQDSVTEEKSMAGAGSEIKPDTKTESETEADVKTESEIGSGAKTESEIRSGAKTESETEECEKTKSETEACAKTESGTELGVRTGSDLEAGIEPDAEVSERFIGKNRGQQGDEKNFRQREKKQKRKSKKDSVEKKQKSPSNKDLAEKKQKGPSKIRTRFERLRKEFQDETNRNAVSHLWKELLKLLRNYKPRKLKADISFSLADPAMTGLVTGIISLMPVIYRYPCSVVPDFTSEKLYIEGEVQASGKVAVYVFALSALRLLRDKEFMYVVRRLMKRDGA